MSSHRSLSTSARSRPTRPSPAPVKQQNSNPILKHVLRQRTKNGRTTPTSDSVRGGGCGKLGVPEKIRVCGMRRPTLGPHGPNVHNRDTQGKGALTVVSTEMLSAGPMGYDRYMTSSGHTVPWPFAMYLQHHQQQQTSSSSSTSSSTQQYRRAVSSQRDTRALKVCFKTSWKGVAKGSRARTCRMGPSLPA